MPNQQSIIIVGGGIIGSFLAYECALAGWDVDVFDPQPEPGNLNLRSSMMPLLISSLVPYCDKTELD